MDIGAYTFKEFRSLAENFHGYAAPGLLVGGYMVELAKRHLPEGTLFEAVVESGKCLPDAVQLLTLCSIGNNWMKIHNLGRYAVSLFDKHTGEGVRVSLDPVKMAAYPELKGWFFKEKPKKDQDVAVLEAEIEAAGDSICKVEPISVKRRFLGHKHMLVRHYLACGVFCRSKKDLLHAVEGTEREIIAAGRDLSRWLAANTEKQAYAMLLQWCEAVLQGDGVCMFA